ncbi:MAG: hypothetical protein LKI80_05410 [Sporolactobacillus sp.]|jgi:ABC-type molybdate transport system permease subunit|nr:hypothetical protein [Sporolactobacillus sp.]
MTRAIDPLPGKILHCRTPVEAFKKLQIPMILPPTVVGYFILTILSLASQFGKILLKWFAVTITMRWQAAVIAAIIVTFLLMYRTVRGAFEAFDQDGVHSHHIYPVYLLENEPEKSVYL